MNPSKTARIAIIDLGSNTARLVIMQAIPGYSYRLEDEIRVVVRLREGMTAEGLSPEAIERAMFTLRLFKRFCNSIKVDVILPTATSAVRDAANGPQFVADVEQQTGLKLKILDGEREAYYGTVGALNEAPIREGIVLDIGGGSAQVSQVEKRAFKRGVSVPLGALALTERFIEHDPITDAEFAAVQQEIDHHLEQIPWLDVAQAPALVGLGGTIRNMAKIQGKEQGYPLNTLHGYSLSRESVAASIEKFRTMPLAERRNISGLNRDRADIILPGAMALASVMDRLETDTIRISVNGLREGVFFEEFWRALDRPGVSDVRRFSVINLARLYGYRKEHAQHVRYLAGRLFSLLQPLHGYGAQALELLESAALLHDIGTAVNYDDHHKHSEMLIINNGLPGFTPRETALIALMTRYHRKGTPGLNGFSSVLQEGDDVLLNRLAALLRLAEYLERGRAGTVEDVTAEWDEDTLSISLIADAYPAVEIWDSERNAAPLMEKAFGLKVRLQSISAPEGW